MAKLLNGNKAAASLNERLSVYAQLLRDAGVAPTLELLRAGEGDLTYERSAVKRCQLLGVEVRRVVLPGQCSQERLEDAVREANGDPAVHGCLLLRPLPRHLDGAAACALLRPEKDVDGVTAGALGGVFTGSGPGYAPCIAEACLALLDYYHCGVEGQRVTVVGDSLALGRPLSMLLLARGATVTLCHARTHDLAAECRRADLLVAAWGREGAIDRGCVSRGQVILDTGAHRTAGGLLRGDVDFASVEPVAGAVSPVPGGVGSVTASILAKHTLLAAARAAGIELGEGETAAF